MEDSTRKEPSQGSTSRTVTFQSLSSCFLLEALRGFCKCLGLEFGHDKTEESSSSSENEDGNDQSNPSSTTTTDPPVDPPSATTDDPAPTVTPDLARRPQPPPVSSGSGPRIN